MKYAKLINGNIVYAPRKLAVGDYTVYNPTPEMLIAEGYKPVVYTEPPGEPDPGYMLVDKWVETSEEILQSWEQVFQPYSEDEALVRYSNELTGASDQSIVEATETLIKIVKEGM